VVGLTLPAFGYSGPGVDGIPGVCGIEGVNGAGVAGLYGVSISPYYRLINL